MGVGCEGEPHSCYLFLTLKFSLASYFPPLFIPYITEKTHLGHGNVKDLLTQHIHWNWFIYYWTLVDKSKFKGKNIMLPSREKAPKAPELFCPKENFMLLEISYICANLVATHNMWLLSAWNAVSGDPTEQHSSGGLEINGKPYRGTAGE